MGWLVVVSFFLLVLAILFMLRADFIKRSIYREEKRPPCEILIVQDLREAELYKRAYPDLLSRLYNIYTIENRHGWQGLRVTRVYLSQRVDIESEIVWGLYSALLMAHPKYADPAPITLRLDMR